MLHGVNHITLFQAERHMHRIPCCDGFLPTKAPYRGNRHLTKPRPQCAPAWQEICHKSESLENDCNLVGASTLLLWTSPFETMPKNVPGVQYQARSSLALASKICSERIDFAVRFFKIENHALSSLSKVARYINQSCPPYPRQTQNYIYNNF